MPSVVNKVWPGDEYGQVARETGGAAFRIVPFGDEQRLKFAATSVASSVEKQIMHDKKLCQKCSCQLGDAGQGLSVCQSVEC